MEPRSRSRRTVAPGPEELEAAATSLPHRVMASHAEEALASSNTTTKTEEGSQTQPFRSPPIGPSWIGGELIHSLTDRNVIFFFSYSPRLGALLSWSANAGAILGVSDTAISRGGNLFLRYVHPDDRFFLLNKLEQTLRDRTPYRATYRWIRPDSKTQTALLCRASVIERDGEPLLEGLIIDISHEVQGDALSLSGDAVSIRSVLDGLTTTSFILDRDLRITHLTPDRLPTAEHLGVTQFRSEAFHEGAPFLGCFPERSERERYAELLTTLLGGATTDFTSRTLSNLNGAVHELRISPLVRDGTMIGLLWRVCEISESVRQEARIAHLEEQETQTGLLRDLTHHLNNSLQSLSAQSALILDNAASTTLVQQASRSMLQTIQRASVMTQQILNPSLATNPLHHLSAYGSIDLNSLVLRSVQRVQATVSPKIRMSLTFGSIGELPSPPESVSQLCQHLIESVVEEANRQLIKYSMPRKNGLLLIQTDEQTIGKSAASTLTPRRYARVSLSLIIHTDSATSHGMTTSKSNAPSRSSSPPSALTSELPPALHSLRSKVQSLGGALEHLIILPQQKRRSETRYSLLLPLVEEATPTLVPPQSDPTKGGSNDSSLLAPQILIIDDDAMVLETVSALLRDAGHRCIVADSDHRALSALKRHAKSLQLILLDVVMPGLGGSALLKRIRKIHPGLKVIGFSGAAAHHLQPLLDGGAVAVLRKPVDPQSLKQVIQETLEASAA